MTARQLAEAWKRIRAQRPPKPKRMRGRTRVQRGEIKSSWHRIKDCAEEWDGKTSLVMRNQQ